MEYLIETRNLVKSYKNRTVVDAVNLHVKKGEIYGFVGPNGAGKSTVMKMLLNLVQPDSGEAYLFGGKIGSDSYESFKRIGSMIESPFFYERITGHENLELHCEYMGFHNRERIAEALRLAGLENIEGKAVSHYSMGMKQRLAIARAILTKPELLILDEPINSLDPEGIREMRTLFRRLNQEYGTTIFLSSHILSEVEQIADTVGILQSGKLLREVSLSEIRKSRTEYIELEVDDAARAGCLLERELGLTDFKIMADGRIEIYDLSKPVQELSAALARNQIGILRIGRQRNSLEDYFFQVTEEV
ncbi:MAG: ATP-binding cassette domain-containing protein [Roseburia sp.]|nr:ATP-binding cassette domain-containing protein [Roseburia sp.]MCM1097998.1 ATP-binding cassette domain-containing protein [Ruminococcus flavefaciens]